MTMSYRNQWPAMSGSFVTTSAAYDQHVETLSGGLGFIVMNDRSRGTLPQPQQAASTATNKQ